MLLFAGCAAADVEQTKRCKATTDSMRSALKAGQTFVATVVKPGTYKPTPGDVVAFRNPEAWGLPAASR